MFTVLFGLHWAIQSVIEWIWHRDVGVPNLATDFPNMTSANNANAQNVISTAPSRDNSVPNVAEHQSLLSEHKALPVDDTDGDILVEEHMLMTRAARVTAEPGKLRQNHLHAGHKHGMKVDKNDVASDNLWEVPVKVPRLSSAVGTSEEEFDVTSVHGYSRMPFLSDVDTVDLIKHSHTMFIMRGLPGSGKSTVVKCLQEVYKGDAVVCSADHYFMDKEENYNFDASRLSNAHNYCQNKAAYHCEKGTRVVIIDNTNIQRWTMAFYVKLAQTEQYYHVIIVEPLTPWRYDPAELTKRNTHGVDEETISKKLQSLQDNVYTPLYYGWFLTKDDSALVVKKFRDVLQQCVEEVSWPDLGSQNTSIDCDFIEEIFNNLQSTFVDPAPMLHCTAAYLARRSKDPYHTSDLVSQSIGKKFSLQISGFVFSKRAISARVNLQQSFPSKTSLTVKNSKDNGISMNHPNDNVLGTAKNQQESHPANFTSVRECDGKEKESKSCSEENLLLKLYMKDEEAILREQYKDVHTDYHNSEAKHAVFQHGCSCHVTVCYGRDSQSKQSGEDILNICELEFYGRVDKKKTSLGELSVYGQDMAQLKLFKPLCVGSMFHGYYSSRGK